MTPTQQIATQADTIKALWLERSRDKRRIGSQQQIIDHQSEQIAHLEAQLTDTAKANWIFEDDRT